MRLAWIFAIGLAAAPAWADPTTTAPGAVAPEPLSTKDIVITVPKDRDAKNIGMIAGIAGAGVLLGAVGVYYNLDSRDAANQVSPPAPTHQPWTPERQALYDQAHSSAVKAGIFYGVGGAALITSVVMLIMTAPGNDTTVIHPHYQPTVAPTQGGAVLGGAWSF